MAKWVVHFSRFFFLLLNGCLLPLAVVPISNLLYGPFWQIIVFIGIYIFGLAWVMFFVLLYAFYFPTHWLMALRVTFLPLFEFVAFYYLAGKDPFFGAYSLFLTSFIALTLCGLWVYGNILFRPTLYKMKAFSLGAKVGFGCAVVFLGLFTFAILKPFVLDLSVYPRDWLFYLAWAAFFHQIFLVILEIRNMKNWNVSTQKEIRFFEYFAIGTALLSVLAALAMMEYWHEAGF